jgi:cell wall-associated NlpC family hydrolase
MQLRGSFTATYLACGAAGLLLAGLVPSAAASTAASRAGGTSFRHQSHAPAAGHRYGADGAPRKQGHRRRAGFAASGGASLGASPGHHAPITARRPNLTYTGPVYERAADGQIVPYEPSALASLKGASAGGAAATVPAPAKPLLLVPGRRARFIDGLAAAPMEAPAAVQQMIWAANRIVGLPYIYGGGHASFHSDGYDCSGTVSFALHGARLLRTPEDSSELESFGRRGIGEWVTIFANPEHAYMDIAGLRLDTSPAEDPSNLPGPRWRPLRATNAGYVVRHPAGL